MTTATKGIKKVTLIELAAILMSTKIIKGMASTAKIIQLTEPKCTKKDRITKEPNLASIKKFSIVNILLNTEYQKGVENQLERENKDTDEYQKGRNTMPIEFGENNIIIGTYKGQFVLQYRPNTGSKPRSKYILDGKLKNKNQMPDVLPKVQQAENQGTDKEILWRKLYLKNVKKLSFNGQIYKVVE